MIKILIVEDEFDIRENIKDILEMNGFLVSTAADGLEGFEKAIKDTPDLIISDIMMPKKNGYELKKMLGETIETSAIPFIYLSAKSNLDDIRLGMTIGADDYLVKPFTTMDVLNSIESRLKRKNQLIFSTSLKEEKGEELSKEKKNPNDRVLIEINSRSEFIYIKDIVEIIADADYTYLLLYNGKKFIVRKLLKAWEEILPEMFLRVHKSTIINLDYVERFEKLFKGNYHIYLKTIEKPVEVSFRYSSRIKKQFGI